MEMWQFDMLIKMLDLFFLLCDRLRELAVTRAVARCVAILERAISETELKGMPTKLADGLSLVLRGRGRKGIARDGPAKEIAWCFPIRNAALSCQVPCLNNGTSMLRQGKCARWNCSLESRKAGGRDMCKRHERLDSLAKNSGIFHVFQHDHDERLDRLAENTSNCDSFGRSTRES